MLCLVQGKHSRNIRCYPLPPLPPVVVIVVVVVAVVIGVVVVIVVNSGKITQSL